VKNESSAPADGVAAGVDYTPKQIKTKVSEIIKKRRDGLETVFLGRACRVGFRQGPLPCHSQRDFFTLADCLDHAQCGRCRRRIGWPGFYSSTGTTRLSMM
jgi:hypothetical protein